MFPEISDDIKLRFLFKNLLEKPLICIKSALKCAEYILTEFLILLLF